MTLLVTVVGALVASLAHLSVSRHAPPPGWGYAWAVYEAGLPLLLTAAHAWPTERHSLLAVAAALSVLAAGAGAYVASHARPALLQGLADAELGRRVQRGARWRRPSDASIEVDRLEADLRRRLRSTPPEA